MHFVFHLVKCTLLILKTFPNVHKYILFQYQFNKSYFGVPHMKVIQRYCNCYNKIRMRNVWFFFAISPAEEAVILFSRTLCHFGSLDLYRIHCSISIISFSVTLSDSNFFNCWYLSSKGLRFFIISLLVSL